MHPVFGHWGIALIRSDFAKQAWTLKIPFQFERFCDRSSKQRLDSCRDMERRRNIIAKQH